MFTKSKIIEQLKEDNPRRKEIELLLEELSRQEQKLKAKVNIDGTERTEGHGRHGRSFYLELQIIPLTPLTDDNKNDLNNYFIIGNRLSDLMQIGDDFIFIRWYFGGKRLNETSLLGIDDIASFNATYFVANPIMLREHVETSLQNPIATVFPINYELNNQAESWAFDFFNRVLAKTQDEEDQIVKNLTSLRNLLSLARRVYLLFNDHNSCLYMSILLAGGFSESNTIRSSSKAKLEYVELNSLLKSSDDREFADFLQSLSINDKEEEVNRGLNIMSSHPLITPAFQTTLASIQGSISHQKEEESLNRLESPSNRF